jgi:hypothetical protein
VRSRSLHERTHYSHVAIDRVFGGGMGGRAKGTCQCLNLPREEEVCAGPVRVLPARGLGGYGMCIDGLVL